ncbi:MAG: hypothetical protein KA436_06705 [Oligoflexales bacterium]|nr:hypothetical protein [Oligoflexales bacterium]
MTGKKSLSVRVQNFLRKNDSQSSPPDAFYKKYLKGLYLYWHEEKEDAITYACDVIEDEFDHPDVFLLYRLWLEILVDQKESSSLLALASHVRRVSLEKEDQMTWIGLRGLIHLWLEEADAVSLLWKGSDRSSKSPHYLEWKHKLEMSLHPGRDVPVRLIDTDKPVRDYFQWQYLAREYLFSIDQESLDILFNRVDSLFPGAPLRDACLFHKKIEESSYDSALNYAKNLTKNFPENQSYGLQEAALKIYFRDFKSSISTLNQVQMLPGSKAKSYGSQDLNYSSEVLTFLGYAHYLKSHGEIFSHDWIKSKKFLKSAEEYSGKDFYPSDEIKILLQTMETKENEKNNIQKSYHKNFWMVLMNSNCESEFYDMSDKDRLFLHVPLGIGVLQGDYVFLSGTYRSSADNRYSDSESRSKVMAVYESVSDAYPHPLDGSQNILKMVCLLEKSMKLEWLPLARDPERVSTLSQDHFIFPHTRSFSLVPLLDIDRQKMLEHLSADGQGMEQLKSILEQSMESDTMSYV